MSESTGTPDTLPWAQIPHWVMLAPISREAKLIYVLLVMHVLRSDPDNRAAWPTQRRLAKLAGFAKPDAIGPRIKELEEIGAVIVERMRCAQRSKFNRNHYIVRLATDPAPMNLNGPLSVWQVRFDLDDDEAEEPIGDPSSGVSSRPRESGPTVVSVDTPPAGGVETPTAGIPVTPPEGTYEDLGTKDLGNKRSNSSAPRNGAGAPSNQDEAPAIQWYRAKLAGPCTYEGCVDGSITVPLDVDPWGTRRCPNCWTRDRGCAADGTTSRTR